MHSSWYTSMFGTDPSSVFLILFFTIVLFLVIREVVTWYWKINRIVDLLENIDSNLASLVDENDKKDIVFDEKKDLVKVHKGYFD